MSPVEFNKRLCRPVEFKGQGPHPTVHVTCLEANTFSPHVPTIVLTFYWPNNE